MHYVFPFDTPPLNIYGLLNILTLFQKCKFETMVQKALFPAIIKEAENLVSFARNLSKNIILFPQLFIF